MFRGTKAITVFLMFRCQKYISRRMPEDCTSNEGIMRAIALIIRTNFEIRGFCEAQNRGERPWLEPVP